MKNKISTRNLVCAAALGLSLAAFGAAPAIAAEAPAEEAVVEAVEAAEAAAADEQGLAGAWELVDVVMPAEEMEAMGAGADVAGSDMVAMMAMMGMSYSLDLNDDGTFVLGMTMGEDSETGEGTWEQIDETTVALTAEGETIEAILGEDGTLTLPMSEDEALIFGREGTATALAPKLATIDDPQGFFYTWKMASMDMPGDDEDVPEELFTMLEALGMQGYLTINEDGTFSFEMNMMEEVQSFEGTVEVVSETEAILTDANDDSEYGQIPVTIEDGKLVLSQGEGDEAVTLAFKAVDPAAWEAYLAGAEAPADEAEAAAGAYADGTYEASGKGIGGDVPVTVTIEGGVITAVEVGENGETQGIGSKAIEQLPGAIVEANGLEGVDGVSGASVTSKAIFSAVEDALAQASA